MGAARHWVLCAFERDTVVRSLKTSAIVGTILGLINHWQHLFPPDMTVQQVLQIGLTYIVPFGVATYGQVSGKLQREAAAAPQTLAPDR
ncbi:MAG: hypothetical protein CL878_15830 [Dehalococcoidia bacterium]|nr:hypothetical protein [Dehalococcoidia bacterium]